MSMLAKSSALKKRPLVARQILKASVTQILRLCGDMKTLSTGTHVSFPSSLAPSRLCRQGPHHLLHLWQAFDGSHGP
jgi:hypothetical protein